MHFRGANGKWGAPRTLLFINVFVTLVCQGSWACNTSLYTSSHLPWSMHKFLGSSRHWPWLAAWRLETRLFKLTQGGKWIKEHQYVSHLYLYLPRVAKKTCVHALSPWNYAAMQEQSKVCHVPSAFSRRAGRSAMRYIYNALRGQRKQMMIDLSETQFQGNVFSKANWNWEKAKREK